MVADLTGNCFGPARAHGGSSALPGPSAGGGLAGLAAVEGRLYRCVAPAAATEQLDATEASQLVGLRFEFMQPGSVVRCVEQASASDGRPRMRCAQGSWVSLVSAEGRRLFEPLADTDGGAAGLEASLGLEAAAEASAQSPAAIDGGARSAATAASSVSSLFRRVLQLTAVTVAPETGKPPTTGLTVGPTVWLDLSEAQRTAASLLGWESASWDSVS